MPYDIYQAIQDFDHDLRKYEKSAVLTLLSYYKGVWRKTLELLENLEKQYQEEKGEVDEAWIYKANRLALFLEQLSSEMRTFAEKSADLILENQKAVIFEAEKAAERFTKYVLKEERSLDSETAVHWNRMDFQAAQSLLGALSEKSPLHELFVSLAEEGTQEAKDTLVQGLLLGENPRKIAPELRKALGTTLSRAMTIARTEILRASRVSAIESYRRNSDLVTGWLWHAALDSRSCLVCWLLHGSFHFLSEEMQSHPNCRCAPVPTTKDWKRVDPEIEAGSTLVKLRSGQQEIEELSYSDKLELFGEARLQYLVEQRVVDRTFNLLSLVDLKRTKWGFQYYLKSFEQLGEDRARLLRSARAGIEGLSKSELLKEAQRINELISSLTGKPGRWTGELYVVPKEKMGKYFGFCDWDNSVVLREDCTRYTLLHELFHTHSTGLSPNSYVAYSMIEEGTVEALTYFYQREILGQRYFNDFLVYRSAVEDLEKMRKATGASAKEFYVELLKVPLPARTLILELWKQKGSIYD
ncbi:MAG: phage minor head protein [Candidatus Methanomethylicaceae archaeon]